MAVTSQPDRDSYNHFSRQKRVGCFTASQSTPPCGAQPQLGSSAPESVQGKCIVQPAPLGSSVSPPDLPSRDIEWQPSPPQSPLLLPRSPSPKPQLPAAPRPEDVVTRAPLLPLTGAPSQHDGLPPPPSTETALTSHSVETIAPGLPVSPVPSPPHLTEAPGDSPPRVPEPGPLPTVGPGDWAAPRPDGDVRRPVQPGTVLARVDALLAAVAGCQQRGETPELLLPARTRWRDVRLCSA